MPGVPQSNVVEVLSEACALIKICDWDPAQICIAAANLGRDGECAGTYANGPAGALMAIQALPAEWVEVVENALAEGPYTVSHRGLRETAEGLYRALQNEIAKARRRIAEL